MPTCPCLHVHTLLKHARQQEDTRVCVCCLYLCVRVCVCIHACVCVCLCGTRCARLCLCFALPQSAVCMSTKAPLWNYILLQAATCYSTESSTRCSMSTCLSVCACAHVCACSACVYAAVTLTCGPAAAGLQGSIALALAACCCCMVPQHCIGFRGLNPTL